MKFITLDAGGMLAGLAGMLALLGHDTDDQTIALSMEAPYLIDHQDGVYRAGAMLYQPEWINCWLSQLGLKLVKRDCARNDVCAALRACSTAMLPLQIGKGLRHPVVLAGYAKGRYLFHNIKRADSPEPDSFSLTGPMLRRRLEDQQPLYTLERCEIAVTDYVPLLLHSLDVLADYLDELLAICERHVTPAEQRQLHQPLFRAVMQDARPMIRLIGDHMLADELAQLSHDYTHIFAYDFQDSVLLKERLPRSSIKLCINGLRENVLDRLYELGVEDSVIDEKLRANRRPTK